MKHLSDFSVGDRVRFCKSPMSISYLRKRSNYLDLNEKDFGTVVYIGNNEKIGIEFDKEIWTGYKTRVSSFDNGCNGFGKMHRCAYIPINCLEVVNDNFSLTNTPVGISNFNKKKNIIIFDNKNSLSAFRETSRHGLTSTNHFGLLEFTKWATKEIHNHGDFLLIMEEDVPNVVDFFKEKIKGFQEIFSIKAYKWVKGSSHWNNHVVKNLKRMDIDSEFNLLSSQSSNFKMLTMADLI